MEIKGNLPPARIPHELPTTPVIPGFEDLKRGEMKYILNSLFVNHVEIEGKEIDVNNLDVLKMLDIDTLKKIRDSKDYLGDKGDLAACDPSDHCENIRKNISQRIKLLQEAARHAGANIPEAEEVENIVEPIRESQHGKTTPPDEGYPF